jgi:hypothetical protein
VNEKDLIVKKYLEKKNLLPYYESMRIYAVMRGIIRASYDNCIESLRGHMIGAACVYYRSMVEDWE